MRETRDGWLKLCLSLSLYIFFFYTQSIPIFPLLLTRKRLTSVIFLHTLVISLLDDACEYKPHKQCQTNMICRTELHMFQTFSHLSAFPATLSRDGQLTAAQSHPAIGLSRYSWKQMEQNRSRDFFQFFFFFCCFQHCLLKIFFHYLFKNAICL